MNPLLKNALELGPVLIWVILNRVLKGVETSFGSGQAIALIVLLVLTVIAVSWLWMAEKKVPWLPLVSAIVLIPMGVLSLVTGDPNFVMIKPTIMWVGLAAVFGGFLLFGRNLFKMLIGDRMPGEIPDKAWNGLAWRYVAIFLLGAVANEALRFYINGSGLPQDEMLDPYSGYKLYIIIGVMVLSVLSAIPLGAHLQDSKDEEEEGAA